jgi:hypothetical protein
VRCDETSGSKQSRWRSSQDQSSLNLYSLNPIVMTTFSQSFSTTTCAELPLAAKLEPIAHRNTRIPAGQGKRSALGVGVGASGAATAHIGLFKGNFTRCRLWLVRR